MSEHYCNNGKENSLLTGWNLWQNQAQVRPAICHDWLEFSRFKKQKKKLKKHLGQS